jgi:tight adherence protein C
VTLVVSIPLLLGLVVAGGLCLAYFSIATAGPSQADMLERRVRRYDGEQPVSLEELELRAPLTERLVRPAIERAGELLARRSPQAAKAELNRKLKLAGRPLNLTASQFTAVRYLAVLVITLVAIAADVALAAPPLVALGVLAVGAMAGWLGPVLYLSWLTAARTTAIRRSLPNALDLLVVTVEAGLGFEAAMKRVAEKYRNPLALEFARVLQETRLGRPRQEAMEDMAARCGVEELHNFVQAVLQSEQLGTPIVNILRTQADDIRRRRLERAQVKGAQASLKMLLPMVGCIFPTIWVILLGPAALFAIQVFR